MTIENQDFDKGQDEVTQQAEMLHPATEITPNHTQQSAESDLTKPAEANVSADKKEKREMPPNSGSMFKNDKKTTSSHPDITGSALVGGSEYWVSDWRKNGAKGDYYSLSFKPKDAPAASSELI